MNWWYVIKDKEVDLGDEDHGKDVNLYVTVPLRTLIEVWEGARDLRKAIADDDLVLVGDRALIRSMPDWFGLSPRASVRPATQDIEAGTAS